MSRNDKGNKARSYNLESVALRELGVGLDKEHQGADWSGELSPEMLEYAATDARVLLPLAGVLAGKIRDASLERAWEIERRATPAIAWMQSSGIPFDAKTWRAYIEDVQDHLRLKDCELDELAPFPGVGEAWNWNSHQQVKTVFEKLGVSLADAKEETLLACEHPFAALLLERRKMSKLVGGFGPGLLEKVQPDGRIYASWRSIGADTGRMSCKEPNLQQLPKGPLRSCVRAPEGRLIVATDYSQIELRIAARVSGDGRMLEAYARGEDLHRLTARSIFDKDKVTDGERGLAKAVNFGLLYGQSARGLRKYVQSTCGVQMSLVEARRYRARFFDTYEGLTSWHRQANKKVPRGRLSETRTLAGRRRFVRNFRERVNSPIQGSGADGLKLALALLWERRGRCPGSFPIAVVHDEVVVECPERDEDRTVAWLESAMKDGMNEVLNGDGEAVQVPIEMETAAGRSWGS